MKFKTKQYFSKVNQHKCLGSKGGEFRDQQIRRNEEGPVFDSGVVDRNRTWFVKHLSVDVVVRVCSECHVTVGFVQQLLMRANPSSDGCSARLKTLKAQESQIITQIAAPNSQNRKQNKRKYKNES